VAHFVVVFFFVVVVVVVVLVVVVVNNTGSSNDNPTQTHSKHNSLTFPYITYSQTCMASAKQIIQYYWESLSRTCQHYMPDDFFNSVFVCVDCFYMHCL
jgi:heme/copper-type cytochrome/quinol oxidase subunit 2